MPSNVIKNEVEALKSVPGIDPVLAVLDGRSDDIPQDGWIVEAKLQPGYCGVINVYRYEEGGLEAGDKYDSDSREEFGCGRISLRLKDYGEHTVAYENPSFPARNVEPHSRMSVSSYTGLSFSDTELIDLTNGGRVLSQKGSMLVYKPRRSFSSLDWVDIDRRVAKGREVSISRVTTNREQMLQILDYLGDAMGMDQQDKGTLVATVDSKTATPTVLVLEN